MIVTEDWTVGYVQVIQRGPSGLEGAGMAGSASVSETPGVVSRWVLFVLFRFKPPPLRGGGSARGVGMATSSGAEWIRPSWPIRDVT